jgi:hypothetical protein
MACSAPELELMRPLMVYDGITGIFALKGYSKILTNSS